jgi:hypothetical protein
MGLGVHSSNTSSPDYKIKAMWYNVYILIPQKTGFAVDYTKNRNWH